MLVVTFCHFFVNKCFCFCLFVLEMLNVINEIIRQRGKYYAAYKNITASCLIMGYVNRNTQIIYYNCINEKCTYERKLSLLKYFHHFTSSANLFVMTTKKKNNNYIRLISIFLNFKHHTIMITVLFILTLNRYQR